MKTVKDIEHVLWLLGMAVIALFSGHYYGFTNCLYIIKSLLMFPSIRMKSKGKLPVKTYLKVKLTELIGLVSIGLIIFLLIEVLRHI
jgi:hypothetical protein